MNHIETQKLAIRDYLLLGLPLTPLEAIKMFGCTKLSSRVGELEREGRLPIVSRTWIVIKNKFKKQVKVRKYQLIKSKV